MDTSVLIPMKNLMGTLCYLVLPGRDVMLYNMVRRQSSHETKYQDVVIDLLKSSKKCSIECRTLRAVLTSCV